MEGPIVHQIWEAGSALLKLEKEMDLIVETVQDGAYDDAELIQRLTKLKEALWPKRNGNR
jgi:hypothetical protein